MPLSRSIINPDNLCLILDDLRKDFKCSICLDLIVIKPVYQCLNGHLMCNDCCPRVSTCPQCRVSLEHKSRCLIMELVMDCLEIKVCKYRDNGCRNSHSNAEHELHCKYQMIKCSQCQDPKVIMNEMEKHLERLHNLEIVNLKDLVKFRCFSNTLIKVDHYPEETFVLRSSIIDGLVHYWVEMISTKVDGFKYKLAIVSPNGDDRLCLVHPVSSIITKEGAPMMTLIVGHENLKNTFRRNDESPYIDCKLEIYKEG